MSDLFQLNPQTEMIWYGVIYLATSGILIPTYILVMMALYRKDCKAPNMTYKMINIINCFELGQVVVHFATSPAFMFPQMQTTFQVGIQILGSGLNACWIASVPMMAILGVTRVLIFKGRVQSEQMPKAIKFVIFALLSLMSVIFLISAVSQNFILKPPSWGYDRFDPYTSTHRLIDQIIHYTSLAIAYGSYLVIVAMICMKKKNSSVKNWRYEVSILLQYTLSTTYMVILTVCYYQKGLFDLTSQRTIAGFNTFWILSNSISPLFLLIMNKAVREECVAMMWDSKSKQTTMKVTPRSSSNI